MNSDKICVTDVINCERHNQPPVVLKSNEATSEFLALICFQKRTFYRAIGLLIHLSCITVKVGVEVSCKDGRVGNGGYAVFAGRRMRLANEK